VRDLVITFPIISPEDSADIKLWNQMTNSLETLSVIDAAIPHLLSSSTLIGK